MADPDQTTTVKPRRRWHRRYGHLPGWLWAHLTPLQPTGVKYRVLVAFVEAYRGDVRHPAKHERAVELVRLSAETVGQLPDSPWDTVPSEWAVRIENAVDALHDRS